MSAAARIPPATWLNRDLRFVLIAVFSQDALTSLIVFAYGNTYLLRTLHTPPSYPAFALGIYGLARLVAAPAAGWFADRAPAAAGGALVGALEACGLLVILASGSAYGYFAGLAFISAGASLAWLLVFRAIGEASPPERRAGTTAVMGLISTCALLVGFGSAGVLAEQPQWRSAFVVALALAAVSAVMLGRERRGHNSEHHAPPRPQAVGAAAQRSPLQRQLVAGTVVFLHFGMVSALVVAAGPFVLQLLDLTLLRAGILLAPAAVVGAATMFLAGRRSLHGRRFREAAVLYAVAAAAILATAPTSSALHFAIGMVPLAAALAGSQPLVNASIVDVAHLGQQPGRVLGWIFFAEGLGAAAGPAIVGVVIELNGVRAGVAAVGVMLLLLTAVAGAAWRLIRL